MPPGRLIVSVLSLLVVSIAASATGAGDVFVVYGRSAQKQVKLVRFITEFPGQFPRSVLRPIDLTLVFQRKGTLNAVIVSRPSLPQATLDSLAEWLVPFNPMSVDTFMVAVQVTPLREAIRTRSKHLGSPHARLVSDQPWFRKGIQPGDTAGGKPRPGLNRFGSPYILPAFSPDTLGSYIIYPPAAKQAGVTGTVLVAAYVDTEGVVEDLVIQASSSPLLDESAARAVRCLRFTPGMIHGGPASMWIEIPISFKRE